MGHLTSSPRIVVTLSSAFWDQRGSNNSKRKINDCEAKLKQLRGTNGTCVQVGTKKSISSNSKFNYEILMIQRTKRAKFFPGAWVFPGGAVDKEDDESLFRSFRSCDSSCLQVDPFSNPGIIQCKESSFRISALREVFEETGILLSDPLMSPEPERPNLIEPGWFPTWLNDKGVAPSVHLLHPWARWITPIQEKRRFDTMFYVAKYIGIQTGRFEVAEADALAWYSPDAIIREAELGSLALPPPTFVCLSEFLNYPTLDAVMNASASARTYQPIQPHIVVDSEGKACILFEQDSDHPRHPSTGPSNSKSRLVLESSTRFRLENSSKPKL